MRHEHALLVLAWTRLKLSRSSEPSHDQVTHAVCYGDLIVNGPSDSSHTTKRVERDAFIPPLVIGGKTQLSLLANHDYLIYTTYIELGECQYRLAITRC